MTCERKFKIELEPKYNILRFALYERQRCWHTGFTGLYRWKRLYHFESAEKAQEWAREAQKFPIYIPG